jgi:hypothetical protein
MAIEDDMLENNSYWDIDLLNQYNAPIWEKINQCKAKKPKTWIGKLWQRFSIFRLKRKLYRYK